MVGCPIYAVGVGRRPSSLEILWQQGAAAFAFLCEEFDFDGPERTEDGIAYHRPDMHIDVGTWAWKHEASFDTGIRRVDRRTGEQTSADLGDLYVAAGLGPAQHVPGNVGGGRTVVKRIAQHATALRRLMPYLTGPTAAELFCRCRPGP